MRWTSPGLRWPKLSAPTNRRLRPISTFLERLREPVSPEAPAGRDARYDEDYSNLKATIDTMSAGSESSIDARLVVETSRSILEKKSRDLAVAGFLTWGLWRTNGFSGLLEGVSTVELLLRDYWADLFPSAARMAGRKNAIEWLNLRVGEQVEAGAAEQYADWELLNELSGRLTALAELLRERFAEDPPIIAGIARPVIEKLRTTKPPAQPGEPSSEAASSGAALPSSVGSDEQAAEAARLIGDYFFAQAPLSRVAHRIQRVARWDQLAGEPPNERGQTLLPPPRENLRLQLDSALTAGNWAELLRTCHDTFDEDACHFWFDLQRYADKALEQLGDEARALRVSLLRDLAGLLERIPGIERFSFSDGTPFADGQTQRWITDVVWPQAAGGGGSASRSTSDAELDEHFSTARSLARTGKLTEALKLIRQGLDADGRARTRFLRRLEGAQLLLDSPSPGAAVAMFEELAKEVDAHMLDQWDPALSARVWAGLLAALRAQSAAESYGTEALYARIGEVKHRLSVVDIETALANA